MMLQVIPTVDDLDPEILYIGQTVYETNRDRHAVWSGAGWLTVKFDHMLRTSSRLDNGAEACIDVTATVAPHQ